MNKAEKIKAEIEKRKQELHPTNTHKMQVGEKIDRDVLMWLNALTWVKNLIDTLDEEPVSNDLEEAAVEAFKHIVDSDKNNFLEIFKAGAEWQKEKMMEDTVDGEIYFNMDYLQYHINTEPLAHFHHGDKVKLIIVKEE